jgi:hypothetical protein
MTTLKTLDTSTRPYVPERRGQTLRLRSGLKVWLPLGIPGVPHPLGD